MFNIKCPLDKRKFDLCLIFSLLSLNMCLLEIPLKLLKEIDQNGTNENKVEFD